MPNLKLLFPHKYKMRNLFKKKKTFFSHSFTVLLKLSTKIRLKIISGKLLMKIFHFYKLEMYDSLRRSYDKIQCDFAYFIHLTTLNKVFGTRNWNENKTFFICSFCLIIIL